MATIKTNFSEVVASRSGGGNLATGESWESRVYVGEFTDATANSIDARNGTGVPAWGAQLDSYALYLMEKSAEPDPKNQAVWRVTCMYRTLSVNQQQPNLNATSHVWQVLKTITPYPVEVPVQKDRNGKVMVNVVGEPIKPSPTLVIYDEQINISFMTDLVDRANIDACKGKVNSSAIILSIGGATASYAANTLLFPSPTIEETYDHDGRLIAKAGYQLLYRKDSWTGLFPNLSFNKLAPGGVLGQGGTNNTPITIGSTAQSNLSYATEAQYLDTSGAPVLPGGAITIVNSGSGYDYISTANFSALLSGLAG